MLEVSKKIDRKLEKQNELLDKVHQGLSRYTNY